jgi:hypothetical protein
MHENRLSLRDLLSITLPFSSSSFFLHNTYSLPLASSSSDAAEQTCVVDSGSDPRRRREGAAAAAFPVIEFCNSVRKKKKQRLGSELLQISREPGSIVGRLQLWNTSTCTRSIADLQRDHRTLDCLALTDGGDQHLLFCCQPSPAVPRPACAGQYPLPFSHQFFRIPLRICAMEGSVSYPEHILNMRDSEFWMREDIGFQLA